MIKFFRSLSVLLVLTTSSICAEPWVDSSNIFLRANIQYLADIGIIKTPTTTFPLMWQDIANDIDKVYLSELDEQATEALLYVRHELKLAKKGQKTLSVNIANDHKRFTSFGEDFRNKNNVQLSKSFVFDNFAAKVATTYSRSTQDGDNLRFDGSYGAFFIGNWVFSAGYQDRWWGPTWDTSLSMTSNARPMPALALSRKSALPLTLPFSEIKIPWTLTTFMAGMDDERIVKDTLLWGFRLNFKPIDSIEIGITRLAQWAGKGRPHGIDTFWNVLKGLDNCGGNGPTVEECAAGLEPGNQLAGYEIRWSPSIFSHPFALYFVDFAEDGDRRGGLKLLGEQRYQAGIETTIKAFDYYWKLYLEGSDSYARCLDGHNGDGTSDLGDCYYEHHIYQTGLRYNGRAIASLYENDTYSLVLGAISQSASNTQFEFKLRWLQLNKDHHDKAPDNPLIGNTLTAIAEDMVMASAKVQHSYRNWRFTFGADISRSQYDLLEDKNDFITFAKVEYNL